MKFIKPPIEKSQYPRYEDHTNQIVHLDRVLTIKKSRAKYYPDNKGIPTITFWFGANDTHEWYLNRDDHRDATFEKIIFAMGNSLASTDPNERI